MGLPYQLRTAFPGVQARQDEPGKEKEAHDSTTDEGCFAARLWRR